MVQQLSQVLEENKQQTLGIVNGVNAVRARAAEEGGPVNGNGGFRQVNGELDGMLTTLTPDVSGSVDSKLKDPRHTCAICD